MATAGSWTIRQFCRANSAIDQHRLFFNVVRMDECEVLESFRGESESAFAFSRKHPDVESTRHPSRWPMRSYVDFLKGGMGKTNFHEQTLAKIDSRGNRRTANSGVGAHTGSADSMTKHFLPEPGATELVGTDYIRVIDGTIAIMVEAETGYFVRKVGTSVPKIIKPPRAKPFGKRRKKFKPPGAAISTTARNNIRGGITSAFRERRSPVPHAVHCG